MAKKTTKEKSKLTVPRSRLSVLRMGTGERYQEDFGHNYVVCDGMLKEYVGIGWIDIRRASVSDKLRYPTAVEGDE